MILTSGKESMNQTVIHADNALYDAKKARQRQNPCVKGGGLDDKGYSDASCWL